MESTTQQTEYISSGITPFMSSNFHVRPSQQLYNACVKPASAFRAEFSLRSTHTATFLHWAVNPTRDLGRDFTEAHTATPFVAQLVERSDDNGKDRFKSGFSGLDDFHYSLKEDDITWKIKLKNL